MSYITQFYEACAAGKLLDIMNLFDSRNIYACADIDHGFSLACENGHLNVVQY